MPSGWLEALSGVMEDFEIAEDPTDPMDCKDETPVKREIKFEDEDTPEKQAENAPQAKKKAGRPIGRKKVKDEKVKDEKKENQDFYHPQ